MMLLHKKLCYLLPCFTALCNNTLISSSHYLFLSSSRLLPFSTATTENPSPEPHFIAEYLINSCGFPSDKANRLSKYLTHIKSPSNPDSVLHFLRQCGFNDTQIRNLISVYPKLLCAKVDKTLKPKFMALQRLGFSESEVIQLVSKNPITLQVRDMRPKIEFWRTLLGTNENLLKSFSRDNSLLASSLDRRIVPNISLLREHGIPDRWIAKMVTKISRFVGGSPNSIEAVIRRAEEFGVSRRSGLFWHVVQFVSNMSRATVDDKFKLLRSLGWSEVEIMSALRKQPRLLNLSENNIRCKMDFFLKEVGCELSYLVCHPVLLSFSLERRLIPRYYVLRVLKREKLPKGGYNLLFAIAANEKTFIEKFVLPHEEKVLGLYEGYVGACAGNVPNFQNNQDL